MGSGNGQDGSTDLEPHQANRCHLYGSKPCKLSTSLRWMEEFPEVGMDDFMVHRQWETMAKFWYLYAMAKRLTVQSDKSSGQWTC